MDNVRVSKTNFIFIFRIKIGRLVDKVDLEFQRNMTAVVGSSGSHDGFRSTTFADVSSNTRLPSQTIVSATNGSHGWTQDLTQQLAAEWDLSATTSQGSAQRSSVQVGGQPTADAFSTPSIGVGNVTDQDFADVWGSID